MRNNNFYCCWICNLTSMSRICSISNCLSAVTKHDHGQYFLSTNRGDIQSLKHEKWGHLVFLDDWELSVPEILPIVTDLVSFCIENGLEKSAQVYSESMMKKFFVDQMVTEKHGNFERQIFSHQDKAIEWLNSYGFTLNDGLVAKDLV